MATCYKDLDSQTKDKNRSSLFSSKIVKKRTLDFGKQKLYSYSEKIWENTDPKFAKNLILGSSLFYILKE